MYFISFYLILFLISKGHYVQTLGEVGEKETENQVLLLEHDIPHQPFSKSVLDCLPVLPWIITDAVSFI